ncbi:uncharacterized protein METZ01_LOCUS421245, partial [marine metagenome]
MRGFSIFCLILSPLLFRRLFELGMALIRFDQEVDQEVLQGVFIFGRLLFSEVGENVENSSSRHFLTILLDPSSGSDAGPFPVFSSDGKGDRNRVIPLCIFFEVRAAEDRDDSFWIDDLDRPGLLVDLPRVYDILQFTFGHDGSPAGSFLWLEPFEKD